jgi:uncharacterized protein
MAKIVNKTIDYKFRASNPSDKLVLIDNSADLQLPSIEKMTDTIKGAGILGEIDMPTFGQISSMTFSVNHRADNGQYAMLSRPGAIKAEVTWVTDVLNSSDIKIGLQTHKVFMTMFNKKYDMGKIEVNAGQDGSSEHTVVYVRKLVDGKEVLLIDQLNNKYVVNGKDYMAELRAALQ